MEKLSENAASCAVKLFAGTCSDSVRDNATTAKLCTESAGERESASTAVPADANLDAEHSDNVAGCHASGAATTSHIRFSINTALPWTMATYAAAASCDSTTRCSLAATLWEHSASSGTINF